MRNGMGSSPHVRGALKMCINEYIDVGIIPACAGSTTSPAAPCPDAWDHPRMCGEHAGSRFLTSVGTGSSPHVRGALVVYLLVIGVAGIIPACAGSTGTWNCCSNTVGDHPRMCGEHTASTTRRSGRSGSSPHVRGALASGTDSELATGIIPACAGSTSWPWTSTSTGPGSSPHVRGALRIHPLILLLTGIIPACAGSTWETSLTSS